MDSYDAREMNVIGPVMVAEHDILDAVDIDVGDWAEDTIKDDRGQYVDPYCDAALNQIDCRCTLCGVK
jgi:hypothetical protein